MVQTCSAPMQVHVFNLATYYSSSKCRYYSSITLTCHVIYHQAVGKHQASRQQSTTLLSLSLSLSQRRVPPSRKGDSKAISGTAAGSASFLNSGGLFQRRWVEEVVDPMEGVYIPYYCSSFRVRVRDFPSFFGIDHVG